MILSSKRHDLKRNLERPWYRHWKACRQRCNDKNASNYKWYGAKGIKATLTHTEIETLWTEANASKMKEPQLSRKDHDKDYTFNNCSFIEKKINVGESNLRSKSRPVEMCSKDGTILKEFINCVTAAKEIHRSESSLGDALHNRSRRCAGFYWRFKNVHF